ncbi:MAG: LD-carboxypeptidase [Saprospiraceae bacterium]
MRRRDFNRLTPGLLAGAWLQPGEVPDTGEMAIRKFGGPILPGMTVGLITPGSAIREEQLTQAVANVESLGLKPYYTEAIHAQYGYLAGTDAVRLQDLQHHLGHPEVDLIWCIRGGYGCSRLLPQITAERWKKANKPILGFSDITAFHAARWSEDKMPGLHGPVAGMELTEYTREQLKSILFNTGYPQIIPLAPADQTHTEDSVLPYTIHPGTATGRLVGGNLSLLAALAGTPYEPDLTGGLLFLEDVGEKPYRIDRMLTQLHQAYHLHRVAGIVLGNFADCEASPEDRSLSLPETLNNQFSGLGVPVYYGFSFGHVADICTFPVGCRATLDTQAATVTIHEPWFHL